MQGVNCVKSEIHSVLTALRIHSTSAAKTRGSAQGGIENPLVRKLKDLYDQLANTNDLSLIDTVQVFDPFLSCIVADNTNAIVTDAALQAVHKFLLYGHVTVHSFNAAPAMSNIAHSVAQCQFDATSAGEAEVVYMKSLEVLVECLRCPAGPLLTDDAVCAMVTQSFAVRSRPNISKLLRRHADNSLLQMVLVIFARLSPDTKTGGEKIITKEERKDFKITDGGVIVHPPETPSTHQPYGVNTMERVLKFLVKLMDQTRPNSTLENLELGCRLVRTAFETAGSRIGQFPSLVQIIQDDLCKRLLQNSQTKHLTILSLTLRIVYDLFNTVKKHLKVQLEVFFTSIHMRIGESESSSYEEKELVLESLVEFCNDEDLIVGLYRNYDCEVSSTNLFEDLCKFLCTSALPPERKSTDDAKKSSLDQLRVLSLEGVLSMLHSLARRFAKEAEGENAEAHVSVSTTPDETKVIEANRKIKQKLSLAAKRFNAQGRKAFTFIKSLGIISNEEPSEVVRFLRTTSGLDKKKVGELLGGSKDICVAIMKHYIHTFKFPFPKTTPYPHPNPNPDPPPPPDENEKVNQKKGEKRGEGGTETPGAKEVRGEVDKSIHFNTEGRWATGRVDRGLRAILETFHLTGEAQQIARILEEFSRAFFNHSPGPMIDADACYMLTYAVMMLHTDAHNPRVAKKMKKDRFISTLRGTNQGKDFPYEYLSDIYDEITGKEFKVLSLDLRSASGEARDVKEIDASWNRLIQSRSTGPFRVSLAPAHGREMFSMLWDQVEPTVMHYFDHPDLYTDLESLSKLSRQTRIQTRRNERRLVLNKIVFGLYAVSRLCAVYHLFKPFDRLLIQLSDRLQRHLDQALNAGVGVEQKARFGRSRRAQKLAHLLFDLLAKHGGSLALEAWNSVLSNILTLHKLGLLPPILLQFYDFKGQDSTPLPSVRDRARTEEMSEHLVDENAGGGGMFGFIASSISLIFAAGEEDEEGNLTEDSEADFSSDMESGGHRRQSKHKLAAVGSACVSTYGIPGLFKSTGAWAPGPLSHLLQAMTKAIGTPQTDDQKTVSSPHHLPVSREERIFLLERTSEIVIANEDRAFDDAKFAIFQPVTALLLRYVEAGAENPTFLTERALVCLLRITVDINGNSHFWNLLKVYTTLAARLKPSSLYAFAPRIVAAARAFLETHPGPVIAVHNLDPMLSILAMMRYHPKAARPSFQLVTEIQGKIYSSEAFKPCVKAICQFFPPDTTGTTWTLIPSKDIFETLLQMHNRIPKLTGCELSTKIPGGKPNQGKRGQLWLYLIGTLCSLCGHRREGVKELALSSLRKALLASWRCQDPYAWRRCFQELLIPMLAKLCEDTKNNPYNQENVRARARGEAKALQGSAQRDLRLKASTLMFQAFLKHLQVLASMPQFNVFWLQFLGSIERYMRLPPQGPSTTPPEEEKDRKVLSTHIVELFKNLVLVMSAGGVFKNASARAGQDLLALTWTVLASFRRDLRDQLQTLVAAAHPLPVASRSATQAGQG